MRKWIQDTCTTILISQVDAAFCKGFFESVWCFSHIWAGIYMFRVLTSGVLLVFHMPDVEHIHYRAFLYSQIVAKFLSQGQEQASKFQCRDHAPVMFCCSAECPEASHSLVEPPKRAPSTKYDHDNFNLVHLPISFEVDGSAPLREPPLKTGPVLFLQTKGHTGILQDVSKVNLSIHLNGMRIRHNNRFKGVRSLAWSPFTVVQANRFHTKESDENCPNVRLFKVADFQNGVSCMFAVTAPSPGESVTSRAEWVATVSCAIRMLTLSLFPAFNVQTMPNSMQWTQTRVLAGHMLLFDLTGVTPVFCELHAPVDYTTNLMAYEDDSCTCLLANLIIDSDTRITERLGVDSGCFTLNEHHFAARTVAEKLFWIRAISNIKVKLRHAFLPTSDVELRCYRDAVQAEVANLPTPRIPAILQKEAPLLKRRRHQPLTSHPANPGLHAPITPSAASDKSSDGPVTPPASAKVQIAVWQKLQLKKNILQRGLGSFGIYWCLLMYRLYSDSGRW